ncbi:hypothetical protein EB093_05160 [bacterium]|nr:hypothetical protein [bacterium]
MKKIIEAYHTLLDVPPDERTIDVHVIIAALATTLGHFTDADHALNAAEALDPSHIEVNTERARWNVEVGDIQNAIVLAESILQRDPNHTGAATVLLDGLFRNGEFSEVIKRYRAMPPLNSLDMAVIASRSFLRTENVPDAVSTLDACLTPDSESVDAHFLRSQLAFLSQDPTRAVIELERACTLDPTFMDGINQLIHSYIELDRWADALPWVQILISRNPEDPEQHFRAALVYEGLGQTTNAISAIDAAIQVAPHDVELHCAKANFYSRSGEPNRAIALLKPLVTAHPQHQVVFQALGVAFQYQERWEDAIKAFKKSIALGGPDAAISAAIGTAYLAMGHRGPATEAFKQSAEWGGGPEFERAVDIINRTRPAE